MPCSPLYVHFVVTHCSQEVHLNFWWCSHFVHALFTWCSLGVHFVFMSCFLLHHFPSVNKVVSESSSCLLFRNNFLFSNFFPPSEQIMNTRWTLREHQVNNTRTKIWTLLKVEWTSREQCVNTKWTPNEHWVWTQHEQKVHMSSKCLMFELLSAQKFQWFVHTFSEMAPLCNGVDIQNLGLIRSN